MKIRTIMSILLIALAFFLDIDQARRGGSSRSSSSSSRGGSRSSGSSGSRTTTRTTKITRSGGGSFSGVRTYGNYSPYGGYVLIVGTPYRDYHYGYYYDGSFTYREQKPMSPVAVIIILVIVVAVLCLCCYIAAKNNMSEDYDEEYTETTTTVHENYDNGGGAATYAPGTNPPGTALCNAGHIFTAQSHNPYPGDTADCDNCQQVIQWQMGGFHCQTCEVDLCQNCGNGRVKPNTQMPPQQQYGVPPAYPPQQQYGQPPAYPPQQQYGQPPAYPPQQQYGQPPAYPPQMPPQY